MSGDTLEPKRGPDSEPLSNGADTVGGDADLRLWLRCLDGEPLGEADGARLARRLRADPGFRAMARNDLLLDGMLLGLGTAVDADLFVRSAIDRIGVERDRAAFTAGILRRLSLRPARYAWRWAAAAAVLALAIGLLWLATRTDHGPEHRLLSVDGGSVVIRPGERITARGGDRLVLGDGSVIEPAPSTRLCILDDAASAVAVEAGEVLVHAAHRPAGEPLRVSGGGASATVVGTRFSYQVAGTETHCVVEEGVVLFASDDGSTQRELRAGQRASHRPAVVDPRRRIGAVALYLFDEGTGGHVASSIRGAPELGVDPAYAAWSPEGLTLDGRAPLLSAGSASAITDAVAVGGALTVEALVTPAAPSPRFQTARYGPARIVTLSAGHEQRNFTLGQGEAGLPSDLLVARLRRQPHDAHPRWDNGLPTARIPVVMSGTRHIVVTCRGRDMRWFIDGRHVPHIVADPRHRQPEDVMSALGAWDREARLAIGGEVIPADDPAGYRAWPGTFHLVGIYSQTVSDAQAAMLHETARLRLSDGDPVRQ